MLARIIPVDGRDGQIDNELPGAGPGIDNTLPEPPPGVWPPPVPAHPIQPAPPETPPGTIWPPMVDNTLPPGVDNTLPGSPPTAGTPLPTPPANVDNTLPGRRNTKFWIVAGIPGYGWKYVCVDVSLKVGNALPPAPVRPGQGLPPMASPKG